MRPGRRNGTVTTPPDPDSWTSSPRYAGHADDPRRRATRHKVDALECDLGEVLDLSSTGMRVACRGKPPIRIGQSGSIRLQTVSGAVPLTGRVAWLRRVGIRRFEVGVDFLNVTRQLGAALDDLARFGFFRGASGAAGTGGRRTHAKALGIRASMNLPDYYSILGVPTNASDPEIREAFRRLAATHHPDATGDPASAETFIRVREAYEVLLDPQRRDSYDRRRAG
jgi:hypothetical protein